MLKEFSTVAIPTDSVPKLVVYYPEGLYQD
jgi:hypothetical protein